MQRYCAVSGETIGKPINGNVDALTFVTFAADDQMILTGSRDNSIIRRSTANGDQIGDPLMHVGSIIGFPISDDGKVIVSCTYADGLCRWDTKYGQLLDKSVSKEWLRIIFGRTVIVPR